MRCRGSGDGADAFMTDEVWVRRFILAVWRNTTKRRLTRAPAPSVARHVDRDPGEHGAPPRVLVNTQPKAGTFWVAALAEGLGFHHTHLHLGRTVSQAYDGRFITEGLRDPRAFDVHLPYWEARALVRSGEVATAHLTYDEERERLLRGFRVIVVNRELRAAMTSYARMYLASDRRGSERLRAAVAEEGVAGCIRIRGGRIAQQAVEVYRWRNAANTLHLRYEDLRAAPAEALSRIAAFLNTPCADPAGIFERATSADSLTKSENFRALPWRTEEEAAFRAVGGEAANAILGYD